MLRMLYGFNRVVEWKHVVAVSMEDLRDGVCGGPLVTDDQSFHRPFSQI
jgi:hypothetical protein